jgi:hypothetical protein
MTREETEAYFRGIEETLAFFKTLNNFSEDDFADAGFNFSSSQNLEFDSLELILSHIYETQTVDDPVNNPIEGFLKLRDKIRLYIAERKNKPVQIGDEIKELSTGCRAVVLYIDKDKTWHIYDYYGVHYIKQSDQKKYTKTGRKIYEIYRLREESHRNFEIDGSCRERFICDENEMFWEKKATSKLLM